MSLTVASWLIHRAGISGAGLLTGMRGTRILDYALGRITPRVATISRITNAYRRANYAFARAEGLGSIASRDISRLAPDLMDTKLKTLDTAIRNIANANKTTPKAVRAMVTRSQKPLQEIIEQSPERAGVRALRKGTWTADEAYKRLGLRYY